MRHVSPITINRLYERARISGRVVHDAGDDILGPPPQMIPSRTTAPICPGSFLGPIAKTWARSLG